MPYYNDYLAHYGVKGMRWGVRRYENEDGTLTALGKKRKAYLDARRKASYEGSKKSIAESNYARREFNDQKIRERLAMSKKKSNRQLKLEEQYRKKGYSKDEAEIQAYKRARTEKVLAVAGGMAIAAIGAYAAYKHYDSVTDRVMKQGSVLGRISKNSDESVRDAFYAFANKHDARRYTGLYGKHTMTTTGKAFKKTISVGDTGLKVASQKSASDILSKMIKNDPEYANSVQSYLRNFSRQVGSPGQRKVFKKALSDMREGKTTKSVYDAFNIALVGHDEAGNAVSSKFYNQLKSMGYSAIRDINDSKYSGYGARNPLIVFDSAKINVDKVEELGRGYVDGMNAIELGKLTAREYATQLSPYAGIAGLVGGLGATIDSINADKYVTQYRKEHPNSELNRNEILKIRDQKR